MRYREGKRFDWFDTLNTAFIDELVETLICNILSADQDAKYTPKTERERVIAKHALSALYAAYHSLGHSWVSFPKSKTSYSTKDTKKVLYSYRSAVKVFDALVRLEWIDILKGNEQKGYTRISAKGGLQAIFNSQGFQWFPIRARA
ncbi:hypothetical protein [Marinobacterium weihaiense]|uniref:Uncharacterized protein n=1 Tax=Marinobacterium weihaiense TaxID=2851016 RepID=A0ABS6MF24_9GAMM|nr:hypothetical protein [Marinobacterium weihaiense]MBV0934902.1 hypothetical protein [Marinobacterium weihaiense]